MTNDELPDVRDGLTRTERLVLAVLAECQRELELAAGRPRSVPVALLYGRLVERGVRLRPPELQRLLARLGARRDGSMTSKE